MAENKTKPTQASVQDYLANLASAEQRVDCESLIALMRKVTKHEPKMWGSTIVGFGTYHYRYESGREGDACLTGFAARKNEIAVYLVAEGAQQADRLTELGKHKMGKACLYIRRLSEIDVGILEKLIAESVAEVKQRYP
jgi:Domain of unknown function (DU1801)